MLSQYLYKLKRFHQIVNSLKIIITYPVKAVDVAGHVFCPSCPLRSPERKHKGTINRICRRTWTLCVLQFIPVEYKNNYNKI